MQTRRALSPNCYIDIDTAQQTLTLWQGAQQKARYLISSAWLGTGQLKGSNQTPLGRHIVRAKIGDGEPINRVFVARRPTGEIYSSDLAEAQPKRDWILTRILWLSGCERGVNRLGQVDTMQRYIYIHGTPDSEPMGQPLSHGCIRMRNAELIELFDLVVPGIEVNIF